MRTCGRAAVGPRAGMHGQAPACPGRPACTQRAQAHRASVLWKLLRQPRRKVGTERSQRSHTRPGKGEKQTDLPFGLELGGAERRQLA